ncbi:hypothetical protein BGZ54_004279 [Gamsiella multidivaricata]|nr:hypothetical protein BGZ54_004279 [Gamsiella multidivaricata]
MSYSSINTNNFIESWRNTLKRHFLKNKQKRRVDTVIYVLAVMAVPHFQQKCICSVVNIGLMNPAQRTELKLGNITGNHPKNRKLKEYTGHYIMQVSDTIL